MLKRAFWIIAGLGIVVCGIAGAVAYARIPTLSNMREGTPIIRTDIVRRLSLSGTVVPFEHTNVYSPTAVRIVRIFVRPGQPVEVGTALAQLDGSTLETDTLRRRLIVARAETALRDSRKQDREVRKLELAQAQLELDRVVQLRKTRALVSPVAGEIVTVAVRDGEMLGGPQGPAPFVIASSGRLQIELEADEFEAAEIHRGQSALVFVRSWGKRPITGNVTEEPYLRRAQSITNGPAVFGVTVTLDEAPPGVRIGTTARVEIVVARLPQSLAVPVGAVVIIDESEYLVELAGADPLRLWPIQTGVTDNALVSLEAGPKAGTRVLVGDADELHRVARSLGKSGHAAQRVGQQSR